jgi:hypothetical protein
MNRLYVFYTTKHIKHITKTNHRRFKLTKMIRVTIPTVDYSAVCAYYNTHKPMTANPLVPLDRIEGGFCIERFGDFKGKDENIKIKQVRWANRKLITPMGYYGMTTDEEKLLYDALVSVYGEEQIFLE